MMNSCLLQRGFFTLRRCGRPAATVCESCSRSACSDHLSPQSGFLRCVECVARESQETDSSSSSIDSTSYDNDWTHSYRNRYHSAYSSTTYHNSDYDSFSTTGEEDVQAEADDPEADFSDS